MEYKDKTRMSKVINIFNLKLQVCRTPNTGHNLRHKQGKFVQRVLHTTSTVEIDVGSVEFEINGCS
jgi:hypothetical protein